MYKIIVGISFIVILSFFSICHFIKIDVFSRAEGEVIPFYPIVYADFYESGIIYSSHVKDGETVLKGQVLAILDNREYKLNVAAYELKLKGINEKINVLKGMLIQGNHAIDHSTLSADNRFYHFKKIKENHLDQVWNFEDLITVDSNKYEAIVSLIESDAASKMSYVSSKQSLLRDKKDLFKVIRDYEERIIYEIDKYRELQADTQLALEKNIMYMDKSILRSPVDGVINYVFYKNEGKYILEGETYSTIYKKSDAPFKIRLRVSAEDIGQIKSNSQVKIRIDTYDHVVFGVLEGKVYQVSLDVLDKSKEGNYYHVDVVPDESFVLKNGKKYPLKYGMTLYATISRGQVSALSYMLNPIIKSFSQIGVL